MTKFIRSAAFAVGTVFLAAAWTFPALANDKSKSDTGSYSGSQSGTSGQSGQGAYGGGTSEGAKSQLDSASKKFLSNAAEINMMELHLAQLAEQQASSTAVKDLARDISKSNGKLKDKLEQFSSEYTVQLPSMPSSTKEYSDLQKLSGQSFDRQFVKTVISQHEKAIKVYEKEAGNKSASSDIQQFVTSTLPELRQHLSMAKNVERQVSQGQTGSFGGGSKESQGNESQGNESQGNESQGNESGGGY